MNALEIDGKIYVDFQIILGEPQHVRFILDNFSGKETIVDANYRYLSVKEICERSGVTLPSNYLEKESKCYT